MARRTLRAALLLAAGLALGACATTPPPTEPLAAPPSSAQEPGSRNQPVNVAGTGPRRRPLNPGRSPDATSGGRAGTDAEQNTVQGTRNPMGGEGWSGTPSSPDDQR